MFGPHPSLARAAVGATSVWQVLFHVHARRRRIIASPSKAVRGDYLSCAILVAYWNKPAKRPEHGVYESKLAQVLTLCGGEWIWNFGFGIGDWGLGIGSCRAGCIFFKAHKGALLPQQSFPKPGLLFKGAARTIRKKSQLVRLTLPSGGSSRFLGERRGVSPTCFPCNRTSRTRSIIRP
jgi:hypothetical protein